MVYKPKGKSMVVNTPVKEGVQLSPKKVKPPDVKKGGRVVVQRNPNFRNVGSIVGPPAGQVKSDDGEVLKKKVVFKDSVENPLCVGKGGQLPKVQSKLSKLPEPAMGQDSYNFV